MKLSFDADERNELFPAVKAKPLMQEALRYAEMGIPVFPLVPGGKIPAKKGGYRIATTDMNQIQTWWEENPEYNIGVPTGKVSSLILIDIDEYKGGVDSDAFWRNYGPRVRTLTAQSPRGGTHYYFRYPEGLDVDKIANDQSGKLMEFVDIRGDGGHAVFPPSIFEITNTKKAYSWVSGLHRGIDKDVAELPRALLKKLITINTPKPKASRRGNGTHTSIAQDVAGFGERYYEGTRNQAFCEVMGGFFTEDISAERFSELSREFNAKCLVPPLNECEIEEKIDSALATWKRRPTTPKTSIDLDIQGDYPMARELVPLIKDRFCWSADERCWREYKDGVWVKAYEEAIISATAQVLGDHYARLFINSESKHEKTGYMERQKASMSRSRMGSVLGFAKGFEELVVTTDEWDANPWMISVKNGAIDLKTGEHIPSSPRHFFTKQCGVAYDPDAISTLWQKQLDLFLPDKEIQRQLQRDMGMALVGIPLEEAFSIWYGKGANGKSTFINVFAQVLEGYACAGPPNLLVGRNEDSLERMRATGDIVGKRWVYSSETGTNHKLHENTIKAITGGERIKYRRLYEPYQEAKPTHSLTISTNYKPEVTGTDEGIWRRVRLIPFTVSLPTERHRPMPEVIDEIMEEGPAILTWMVQGLMDWQNEKHWVAEAVKLATQSYRQDSDIIGKFIEDTCLKGRGCTVGKKELYDAFSLWCVMNDESEVTISNAKFSRQVGQNYEYEMVRRGKTTKRIWKGIELKKDDREPDKMTRG